MNLFLEEVEKLWSTTDPLITDASTRIRALECGILVQSSNIKLSVVPFEANEEARKYGANKQPEYDFEYSPLMPSSESNGTVQIGENLGYVDYQYEDTTGGILLAKHGTDTITSSSVEHLNNNNTEAWYSFPPHTARKPGDLSLAVLWVATGWPVVLEETKNTWTSFVSNGATVFSLPHFLPILVATGYLLPQRATEIFELQLERYYTRWSERINRETLEEAIKTFKL